MQVKKKLELTIDVDNPIEEIKESIIAISIFHGPKQLDILKEVEIWLGKTIEETERKRTEVGKEKIEDPAAT